MKKPYVILIVLSVILGIVLLVNQFFRSILSDKPRGPYHSSKSILESQEDEVFLNVYKPDRYIYYSSVEKDSFYFKEIWIEKNVEKYPPKNEKFILIAHFQRITDNDLHKFRLVAPNRDVQHPDGNPRIRFRIDKIYETIQLEVIERNPEDREAWLTEEPIDTITLTIVKN